MLYKAHCIHAMCLFFSFEHYPNINQFYLSPSFSLPLFHFSLFHLHSFIHGKHEIYHDIIAISPSIFSLLHFTYKPLSLHQPMSKSVWSQHSYICSNWMWSPNPEPSGRLDIVCFLFFSVFLHIKGVLLLLSYSVLVDV